MCQSRSGVVGVVESRLALLIRGLRTRKILLVLLLIVLILLRLTIQALVRVGIEVPAASTTTISSGAVMVLHWAPKEVRGRLASLVLEDGLREGGGSGRIYSSVGSRVLTIGIVPLSWKTQVKAVVGIHDA